MDALALLCNLHADGPLTTRRLQRAGCHTIQSLRALPISELARILDVPQNFAERFALEAQYLAERSSGSLLEDETPQYGAATTTPHQTPAPYNPMGQPIGQPQQQRMHQPPYPPIGQPIGQPIGRPMGQPMQQQMPIHQPMPVQHQLPLHPQQSTPPQPIHQNPMHQQQAMYQQQPVRQQPMHQHPIYQQPHQQQQISRPISQPTPPIRRSRAQEILTSGPAGIPAPPIPSRPIPTARTPYTRQQPATGIMQQQGTLLSPGLLEGLDVTWCEGLVAEGITTVEGLAASPGMTLARRLGKPLSQLVELQSMAQRFTSASIQPQAQPRAKSRAAMILESDQPLQRPTPHRHISTTGPAGQTVIPRSRTTPAPSTSSVAWTASSPRHKDTTIGGPFA